MATRSIVRLMMRVVPWAISAVLAVSLVAVIYGHHGTSAADPNAAMCQAYQGYLQNNSQPGGSAVQIEPLARAVKTASQSLSAAAQSGAENLYNGAVVGDEAEYEQGQATLNSICTK